MSSGCSGKVLDGRVGQGLATVQPQFSPNIAVLNTIFMLFLPLSPEDSQCKTGVWAYSGMGPGINVFLILV